MSRVRTQCKVPRPRQYEPLDEGPSASARRRADQVAAGFLSNITNPKVLVFYLAVLPQFLGADAGLPVLLAYALSHAALSLVTSRCSLLACPGRGGCRPDGASAGC